ncbi:cuticle protein 16.5 isoform X2 [Drosophila mojavensis]|uniref:cuticle protein 16.5 isoform X2 n=1 Tax=Drosophila mojavensis TaxID=7230 RepID=UPI0013EE9CD7|nr:cuticle protein 16.5 isoform X2 [Drosophila mojavensis]
MKLLLLVAFVACVAADVSHLPTNQYLPPGRGAASAPVASYASYDTAASAPVQQYSAPVQSYSAAASAPVQSYAAPVQSYSAPVQSYSAPATYTAAASAPVESYSAPVQNYNVAASAPVQSYSAPVAADTYETSASEPAPAHSFSPAEGYRYKTHRRVVLRRHRRGVPSNDYLPPFQGAASAPVSEYLPPAASAPAPVYTAAASAPVQSYSAPAVESYGADSYDTAASEPVAAHTFSSTDGYRYKTHRRVIRRRRY